MHRLAPLVLFFVLPVSLAVAPGCRESATSTLVGPTPARCQASVAGVPSSVPHDGATVNATVTAARECSWSVTAEVSWLQVNPSSGQGEGSVAIAVAANPAAASRSGAVAVNEQRLTLTQEPAPCRFELDGTSADFTNAGGRVVVEVATLAGCSWDVSGVPSWVSPSRGSGAGSGTVEFLVQPNTGGERSASLTVAGQPFVLRQAAAPPPPPAPSPAPAPAPNPTPTPPPPSPPPPATCSYAVDPAARSFAASGGTGNFQVQTSPGCAWTASSTMPWLQVTAGLAGTGPGTVTYTVAANSGAARQGAVTAGGALHTVSQQAALPVTVRLEGRISKLSGRCPSLTFIVRDRTVVTSAATVFLADDDDDDDDDGDPCRELGNGDEVIVEGVVDDGGRVLATRVRITD